MSNYHPSMSYNTYASNYMPSTAAGPGSASVYPPSTSIDQGSASAYPPSTSVNQGSASAHQPSTSTNPATSNMPSWIRFSGTKRKIDLIG